MRNLVLASLLTLSSLSAFAASTCRVTLTEHRMLKNSIRCSNGEDVPRLPSEFSNYSFDEDHLMISSMEAQDFEFRTIYSENSNSRVYYFVKK